MIECVKGKQVATKKIQRKHFIVLHIWGTPRLIESFELNPVSIMIF